MLDVPIKADLGSNFQNTTTLREVFKAFLRALISEGESFSGKRPLGNSDWDYVLAGALIESGLLKGVSKADSWGDNEYDFDWAEWTNVINNAINEL